MKTVTLHKIDRLVHQKNVEEEILEIHTWTQEAVNLHIKGFIAPLKPPLEELIRMVQGNVTTPPPSHYPRTDYSSTSGTAAHQSDTQVVNS